MVMLGLVKGTQPNLQDCGLLRLSGGLVLTTAKPNMTLWNRTCLIQPLRDSNDHFTVTNRHVGLREKHSAQPTHCGLLRSHPVQSINFYFFKTCQDSVIYRFGFCKDFLKGVKMFKSRQGFLSVSLTSLLMVMQALVMLITLNFLPNYSTIPRQISIKLLFMLGCYTLNPYSNNLKYATFVSGTQPYYQSWHYQEIKPAYHSTFELGFNYAIPHTSYSASVDWTHLDTNDSSSKQATTNTDLTTVEFVGPPYEMSPPVFGIKHVDSSVNFNFDSVLLNGSKLVEVDSHFLARFFGGIDFLKLNQTLTTTFSDYAGSPPTPYSYPLPPDPSFSFQTKNLSKYFGAGPDIGLSLRYKFSSGFWRNG